jgi:hypothetical protein
MDLISIFRDIIIPILYVVGIIVIYCHQRSMIKKSEKILNDTEKFMNIFDIKKVRDYVDLNIDKAEKEKEKAIEEHEKKLRSEINKNVGYLIEVMRDYYRLILEFFYLLADSKFPDMAIEKLREGEVKSLCKEELARIRKTVVVGDLGLNLFMALAAKAWDNASEELKKTKKN